MENCEDKLPVVACGGCCCVSICVLILCSLGSVPPLFYGLRYNAFSKSMSDEDPYSSGRYLIGPWNNFILFPSNAQNIEFTSEKDLPKDGSRFDSLVTRTSEGLTLNLQLSLQYQLKKDKLKVLYSEFNTQYEFSFVSSMRDKLNKVAMKYDAETFWTQRSEITRGMQAEAESGLSNMDASCWGLQLMVIDLPDSYEQRIVDTQVRKQAQITSQYDQQVINTRAQTSVIMAEYDRQVKVITAQGQANYTVTTKEAAANARQNTINIEADVLKSVATHLNLSKDDLVTFQKYSFYGDMDKANVFLGFDDKTQMNIMMQKGKCKKVPPSALAGLPDIRGLATEDAALGGRFGENVEVKSVELADWDCECEREQAPSSTP